MAKRFATMFFIMIGVVVFLLSTFVLVLFLAPGTSIFGIKYISINTHGINTGKVNISDQLEAATGTSNFSGSIVVNSDEVPIIVEFADAGQSYYFEYYDNYSGITSSSFDDPSISLELNSDGAVVLNVQSYDTYVFENANSKRYLKLYIPLANISVSDYSGKQQYIYGAADPGAALKYTTNLTINAGSASVSFASGDTSRAAAFNTVSITTTGTVSYNGVHVKALTFKYVTNNTITLTSSVYSMVDALNYDFTSTSGKVICQRELSGDFAATTGVGNIEINRCKNLTVTTDLGDIVEFYEGFGIEVSGLVNIKTNAGSFSINKISGSGQNKIETGSGSVEIGQMSNGTITTHRGAVTIQSVNNVTISTNMGNVSVEEVLSSINVITKRGKIEIGADGMVVGSVKASSTMGKITVIDATGTVAIDTVSSDIKFVNKSSTNIQIYAGGHLNAQNLKGTVNLTLAGTAEIEFESILNDTQILLKETCTYVNIDAVDTIRTTLNYFVYGNPVNIYESNNTGYSTFSLIGSDNYLFNSNPSGVKFEIVGDTKTGAANAQVDIYFNRTPD